MTTRNLEPDQWGNREEWRLVSGRRRQQFKKIEQIDRIYLFIPWIPVLAVEWSRVVNTLFVVTQVSTSLNEPKVKFCEVLLMMQLGIPL